MDSLKYSDNEIKIFQEALSNAIDDLESFWQIGALENIIVPVLLPGFFECQGEYIKHNWNLIINKLGIYISSDDATIKTWLARRKSHNKLKKYLKIDEEDIIFLNNFVEIRELVSKQFELAVKEKQDKLDQARLITQRYNKEATIEINMPETNNQHTIELMEENGKKIGTIAFRGVTIKIITDANIEFKNKIENQKIKRK